MASDLKPLQDFFKNRVFRIPDYQRGYAWGEGQLEDFWQDLKRIPDGRNHNTGQITLEPVPKQSYDKWDEDIWLIDGSNYKPFYVVDGQQRLTTAVILLKCLIDAVPDGGALAYMEKSELVRTYLFRCSPDAGVSRVYLFGYEKDNPSYEYLKTQVLDQPSNSYRGTETVYTANLKFAREFFSKRLKGLDLPEIDVLFRGLTQRFVFNEYELDADLDVFVAFETMNNRGKQLSKLELLKNRLIYLSTLAPINEDERRTLRRNINEAWKTVYEYLGKEGSSPLDDDEFLKAHWIMSSTYARDEAQQFAAFLLNRHFTPDQVVEKKLGAAEIQEYVDSIQNSVKAWYRIHFPEKATELVDEVRCGLERCARVGRGAFPPLMMAALQMAASTAELVSFLDAAERFVFVVSRLCQRRADTGDSEFYSLASKVNQGDVSLKDATAQIEARTLRDFSLEKSKAELSDLFNKSQGFYTWTGCRYLLFEYEQHLRATAGMQAAKIDWEEFDRRKKEQQDTVEHVYPQTPKAGEWPGFEMRTDSERHNLRHSVGNLLPLSQSRNTRFSNRSFAAKKQDNDGVRGYFNGSYSEIAVAQLSDWTPKEVLQRGLDMLDFLEKRWRISLGGRADKVKLLGLDFLEAGVPASGPSQS